MLEVAGRELAVTQPGQGLLLRARRDEARPRPLLPRRRGAAHARDAAAGRCCMQRFPHGAERHVVLPEARARQRARLARRRRSSARRTARRRARSSLADLAHVVWAVNLGCLGFHVWPYARRRPRARRRAAHRPRPAARRRLRRCPRRGRASCARCSTSSASSATRRRPATAASTSTSGSSRAGTRTRCARRRSPSRASSSAAAPTLITAAWWKEERGERVFVDFNQNAPHKTVFGAWSVRARPGAQVSTPFALGRARRDPSRRADDRDACPRGCAARGDPWATIDDEPQSLEPLLELHERDLAAGLMDAPWPPVYPKMPGEPPRVAPSRARKDAG